jgi:hypothetical protein
VEIVALKIYNLIISELYIIIRTDVKNLLSLTLLLSFASMTYTMQDEPKKTATTEEPHTTQPESEGQRPYPKTHYWQYDPENPKAFEKELYRLPLYVKEGNVEAVSQLRAKMQEWDAQGYPGGYSYARIKNGIFEDYRDFLKEKDEAAVKIMAPLIFGLGESILYQIGGSGCSYDRKMQKRWEIDVVSQVPGVMIAEFKEGFKYKSIVERSWPFIPRHVQKRIKAEVKNYYKTNCPQGDARSQTETDECRKFGNLLHSMKLAHRSFPVLCQVIAQEIKEQEAAAKQATT